MDPNTLSTQDPGGWSAGQAEEPPDGLAATPDAGVDGPAAVAPDIGPELLLDGLLAALDQQAALDLNRLPEVVRAQRVPALRGLADQLQGQWLKELAGVDALGAAGADQDQPPPSTASWLRRRLRLSASAAHRAVRTARALFRGPLAGVGQAVVNGELSVDHAQVLADGTAQLPDQVVAEAEPVLLEAARRLDPPTLRRAVGHLVQVAHPDGADRARERRHERRGLWLSPTWEDMVAVNGLLEPEAGNIVLTALESLARPHDAEDRRSGGQRTADALAELARRALEGGRLPQAGGVRPQLLITVDLDSLLGRAGGLGGEMGQAGPLAPQACRRLACDGAVTRVLVSRQTTSGGHGGSIQDGSSAADDRATDHSHSADPDPDDPVGIQERLRTALALLPPVLGGASSQPLEVSRSIRVVHPAQRAALAVRDGGCVFPGCDRPLAWCDAHHLQHWVDGGPTDLSNLAMVCRAHHRTVHEEGWQLTRGPDGRFTATSSTRRTSRSHRPHRHRASAVP